MITRDDGLTDAEGTVQDALIAAVQAYWELPIQHPDETRDFVDAIHVCQNQLTIRIARRAFPKGWPDNGPRQLLEHGCGKRVVVTGSEAATLFCEACRCDGPWRAAE